MPTNTALFLPKEEAGLNGDGGGGAIICKG